MQISFFDGKNDFLITKPIRLIEFFAGYGSQNLALKYLGVKYESYKICEWAVNSIQAYKDFHFKKDNNDYSKYLSCQEIIDYLYNKGISINYNEPMTYEQIKRLGENRVRTIYNNIKATHNLVNIQKVKGKDLQIVDTDKYDYIMTYSFPCITNDSLILTKEPIEENESNIAKCITTRSGSRMDDNYIIKDKNQNLKTKLCNKLIENNLVHEGDVIRHNYTTSKDIGCIQSNNEIPTLDTRCDCLGVVVNEDLKIKKETENYIQWEQKGYLDVDCRAWKENAVAPTTTTTAKSKVLLNNLRIRKLTPKECFRLMGVKDEDFENIRKNQSNASLYHLAGDSIVTTCLMAIFGNLLGIDYKEKIKEFNGWWKNE